MIIFFSIFLTFLNAFLLIKLMPLCHEKSWQKSILQLIIWLGFILGLNSISLFIWMITIGSITDKFILFEILTSAILLAFHFKKANKKNANTIALAREPEKNTRPGATVNRWISWILLLTFLAFLIISISYFLKNSFSSPTGQWDAWAIWNLRARFLLGLGENWKDIYANTVWSHTDYPLLLSNSIARYWTYTKNQTALVPIFMALFFTTGTIFAIFSSISAFKGKIIGLLSAIVIMGTPFFYFGSSQYADVPLSFFMLASLILLAMHLQYENNMRHLTVLLGFYVALAAWTKNEGLLFFTFFLILYLAMNIFLRKERKIIFQRMALLLTGSTLIILPLLFMKVSLAPKNDLAPTKTEIIIKKLTTVSRYKTIKKGLEKNSKATMPIPITLLFLLSFLTIKKLNIFKRVTGLGLIIFGGIYYPYLLPLIALILLLTNFFPKTQYSRAAIFSFATINLMLLGYAFTYLITPNELRWHINTSMNRLFIQLVPSIIFAIALTFSAKEERGY
jgi:hypothetical protein